jgi:hypothetical protein
MAKKRRQITSAKSDKIFNKSTELYQSLFFELKLGFPLLLCHITVVSIHVL